MLTDEHLRAPLNPKAPPMAGTSTVDKSGGFTSLTSLPGGGRSFVGRYDILPYSSVAVSV